MTSKSRETTELDLRLPNFMTGGPFLTQVLRGGAQKEHCRIAELQRYILEIRKTEVTGAIRTDYWKGGGCTESFRNFIGIPLGLSLKTSLCTYREKYSQNLGWKIFIF